MSQTTTVEAPAVVGAEFQGGYFAGLIRQSDGIYAVIVAPKAQGETTSTWSDDYIDVPGATSFSDGAANTIATAEAGLSLAKWARSLEINGFTDWHIPSRDELEICYRNLKPTAEENYCRYGDNPSSVPPGYPYAVQTPAQNVATAFQAGGSEAFEDSWHWSSTQYSRYDAWIQLFDVGTTYIINKDYTGRVRAVRRFKVQ